MASNDTETREDIRELFELSRKNAEAIARLEEIVRSHAQNQHIHGVPPCDNLEAHLGEHAKRGERSWSVILLVISLVISSLGNLVAFVVPILSKIKP